MAELFVNQNEAKEYFDENLNDSLGAAKFGDYRTLAARIREGSACNREREFAADILEGKRKRAKSRPKSWNTFKRNLEIYNFVVAATATGELDDAAVYAAQKRFAPSKAKLLPKTNVYDACTAIKKIMEEANAGSR
ncbi:MAG: hypothetical protein PSV22_24670 [Pseudolabrys sp.]|nr:hypothetical protein [Pseudolabrys sp.]